MAINVAFYLEKGLKFACRSGAGRVVACELACRRRII
jgi:hypothetical protein